MSTTISSDEITKRRRWTPGIIGFSTSYEGAVNKLQSVARRLGVNPLPEAKELDYGLTVGMNASAFVKLKYKGSWHEFSYSRQKAEFFKKKVPDDKDIFVSIVMCLQDLAKVAERGVFDFGILVQGFKQLEYKEVPGFIAFFGFTVIPSWDEFKKRFADLMKTTMNRETNPRDAMLAKQYYDKAKEYYKVR